MSKEGFFWNFRRHRETSPSSSAVVSQDASGGDWAANVVRPNGRGSLLVPAWHRGVSLIMQTMGQMVVQYQRVNTGGGNYIEDRYGDSRLLNYLLQVRPNPLMTASQLLEQIEYRKIYFGNAYVLIERDELWRVKGLWLCQSGSYNVLDDSYTLTWTTAGGVKSGTFPSSSVLHFKNVFLSDDYLKGIPTVAFAAKALSIAATADEQSLADLAKGGKMKILVQEKDGLSMGTRGRANKDQLKKITAQLNSDIYSQDVMLLNNVADAKVISQTSQQMQVLESRGFQVSDIARILGIPRIMMMEQDGNYKMPEHATQEFMLRTIQPRIREMEDEMNSKLLGVQDFGKRRIHICELALRRLDAKGQAEIDKIHLETGVNTVNELRNQYDLPTVAGGDLNYVSTNLAELGSEKLRGVSGGGGVAASASGPAVDEEKGGEL